ncbi:MAG: hypothetical protein V1725_05480 [archaeon]
MKKTLIFISILVLILAVITTYFAFDTNPACSISAECALANAGNDPCLCDTSSSDFVCVSLARKAMLDDARQKVLCSLCPISETSYRCECSKNACVKTNACTADEECRDKNYVCKDGVCRRFI